MIPDCIEWSNIYILGKLPSGRSGLYILGIDYSHGTFDSDQGLITSEGKVNIHVGDGVTEDYNIELYHGRWYISYERTSMALADVSTRLIVSVSKPRRMEGVGVVYLVDIEGPKDLEIKVGSRSVNRRLR